ncbi:AAA family ATPase [Micromonospora chalcea]|uniref:AAA family ATPase n=1 Tax=Micromonospora chalcea TaxID=1874 RepID=UPI000CE37244|nr:AAA family ATPase [Micromonospora chalcea]
MGELLNPRHWQSGLDGHHEVLTALARWMESVNFDLEILHWFDDGRSDRPVALVLRTGRGHPEQLVLKFCEPGARTAALSEAWEESPGYRRHLAKVDQVVIPVGEWTAVFLSVAGDDQDEFQPLSRFRRDPSLPACLRRIASSVVRDWNPHRTSHGQRTVGEVLQPIVRRHIGAAETWARGKGLSVAGDSPFALVTGADAGRPIPGAMLGRAHGDLSARNIFVQRGRKLRAGSYVLIDYDHFSREMLLAFDPMHLVVALALDDFDRVAPEIRTDWIRAIVNPDIGDVEPEARAIRKIARQVQAGVLEAFPERGLSSLWRQQLLLGLVGAGLMHVGRELRATSPDEARRWCYDLAAAAAEAARRKLPAVQSEQSRPPPAAARRDNRRRHGTTIINRESERVALHHRLTEGPFGAVVISGLAGIGKSEVLHAVLDDMQGAGAAGPAHVYRQVVDAATRLDLKSFMDGLEGREAPPTERGHSSLARLERVLDELGGRRVIVALDAAHNLLAEGTHELADADLDEALELLTNERGHQVSVVLAFRGHPASSTGGTWPGRHAPIPVPELKPDEFFKFLGGIDRDGALRLGDLDDKFREKLHGHLQGNPRSGELVHALVADADRPMGLRDLATLLFQQSPAQVPHQLIRLLVERLGELRGGVLQALAAFDTPIPESAVVSALSPKHRAEDIRAALDVLNLRRVIYRNDDGDYHLPGVSGTTFLDLVPMSNAARVEVLSAAARALTELPARPVTAVRDLRLRLAQINALLNARQMTDAYRVIEEIDMEYLFDWNCRKLVLRQRRRLRGKLGDHHREMTNEEALADIALTIGDLPAATDSFARALAKARALGGAADAQRIQFNQAGAYLEAGKTQRARARYRLVRDDRDGVGDLSLCMGALIGLADCNRRHGHFGAAIRDAEQALSLLELPAYPRHRAAAAFTDLERVFTLLRLTRWHIEQNDLDRARDRLREADSAAARRAPEWLLAARRDALADLRLAEDETGEAIRLAEEAVALARAKLDEVVLLQARTTLSVAHLRHGDPGEARREIERAHRLRRRDRPGRSLLVLAVLALTTAQTGDPGAATGHFRQLADEAEHRLLADRLDFAARDMLGFGLCGQALTGDAKVGDAAAHFGTARRQVRDAPGLVARLRFLLQQLDRCGNPQGRLQPALEALAQI